MNRISIWGLGAAVSLTVHLAVLMGLWLSLEPKAVENQPTPPGRLDVQTFQLERKQAKLATPQSHHADESKAESTKLGQSILRHSRDVGTIPTAQSLQATLPVSAKLKTKRPTSASLPHASLAHHKIDTQIATNVTLEARDFAPTTLKPATRKTKQLTVQTQLPAAVQSAVHEPLRISNKPPSSAVLFSQSFQTNKLVQTRTNLPRASQPLPSATSPAVPAVSIADHIETIDHINTASIITILPVAFAKPESPTSIQPTLQSLVPTIDKHDLAANLPLPAITTKATLAFSSDTIRDVDPVSLIAFQSFMQAHDLGTSSSASGKIRDGISALLADVPCSRLQVNFIPETGTLMLNGHLPENGLRAPVLAALKIQVGKNIQVADNTLILGLPMCNALSNIANAGLPSSTDQITNPKIIGENTQIIVRDFKDGERLTLDFTAPDYDAFVYVDYFDITGQVVHLAPNKFSQKVFHTAKESLRIGRENCEENSLEIRIGPPFGQELGIAVATSVQLIDGFRPIIEPAEPYIVWLNARLTTARAENRDFKGEWFYFIINSTDEKYVPNPESENISC